MNTFIEENKCLLPGIRHIISLESTESTQLIAKALAEAGCSERTAVIAASQTAGYGRLDHKWSSALGGLYLSLLMRPNSSPACLPDLSALVAETISGVLHKNYGVQARVKLPNDVYAFHESVKKWRKISGVLSESAAVIGDTGKKSEWLIIGIGININNSDFPETGISLKDIIGRETDIMEFAEALFRAFWPAYSVWECSSRMKS